MFKLSRKRSTISRFIFISMTLCTLILMTVFITLSNNVRAADTNPEATPGATGTMPSTGPAAVTGRAVLMHTPNGVVRVIYNSGNTVTLNPKLSGFSPNSTHSVQIEQGTCSTAGAATGAATSTATTPVATATTGTTTTPSAAATPTAAATTAATATATGTTGLYSTTLTADSTGRVQNSATINNVTTPMVASNTRVQIYSGTGAQKIALSCGNLKPYNPSSATATATGTAAATSTTTATGTATGTGNNTFTAVMGPANSPNGQANGMAQLSLKNGTLMVQLNVRGLAPNSSHTAHIHAGTCQNIGNVVYNLGTLTADAQGTATLMKSFPNVTSIPNGAWAAQVHYGTNLSTPDQYTPIMCGTVHTGTGQPSATATP